MARITKKQKATHYIYALIDPRDGSMFYIGQTNNPARRLVTHCKHYQKRHNKGYILKMRSIIESGHRPIMEILATGTNKNIDELEVKYIRQKRLQGHPLTNILEGGRSSRTRLT